MMGPVRAMAPILLLLLPLLGCGSAQSDADTAAGTGPLPDPDDPAYAARFDGTVDERVSTSAGEPGGVVVLWPRVVTSGGGDAPEAAEVQRELRGIVERAADARAVDVRPEPQRVCPQGGCRGLAVGAVLLRSGTGCAAVATVSQPGETPTQLVAWAGDVQLRNHNVPFREPPEQHLSVRDFVPCEELTTALLAGEPAVAERVRQELSRVEP